MKRPILLSTLLSLAGCGFTHPLPLREVYDSVTLGQPLSDKTAWPENTELKRKDRMFGTTLWNDWDHATGAAEWAAFLEDEDGNIVAKRYQVRGEEGSLSTMRYKRIDRSDWTMLVHERAVETAVIRRTCQDLSLRQLPGPTSYAEEPWTVMRFDAKPPEGDVEPWDMLDAAETEGNFQERPPNFHRIVRTSDGPGGIVKMKTTWKLKSVKASRIEITVEHRTDVSLVLRQSSIDG